MHLGSLICAVASFLDARHCGGRWLLRMEDLDPPREVPGAAQAILQALQEHGLHWDGDVVWQSQRHPAYATAMQQLISSGRAFACDCSRQQLARDKGLYRGHCRQRQLPVQTGHAVRLQVKAEPPIQVPDRVQAHLTQNVAAEISDFVIQRKDQLYAYQLAVVVDDAWQGITHVVRGSDLYESTPRQIVLQRELQLSTPSYCHIPVLTNRQGQKLSKQTHAPALDPAQCGHNLRRALAFLQQPAPPLALHQTSDILDHAIEHWCIDAIPRRMAIPDTDAG